jgi:hypothetical protein
LATSITRRSALVVHDGPAGFALRVELVERATEPVGDLAADFESAARDGEIDVMRRDAQEGIPNHAAHQDDIDRAGRQNFGQSEDYVGPEQRPGDGRGSLGQVMAGRWRP